MAIWSLPKNRWTMAVLYLMQLPHFPAPRNWSQLWDPRCHHGAGALVQLHILLLLPWVFVWVIIVMVTGYRVYLVISSNYTRVKSGWKAASPKARGFERGFYRTKPFKSGSEGRFLAPSTFTSKFLQLVFMGDDFHPWIWFRDCPVGAVDLLNSFDSSPF